MDIGQTRVILRNTKGDIEGIYHRAKGAAGVIWVSGSLGGLDGPSFGIFQTLGTTLVNYGISSLRLDYRLPGDFDQCVYDVLVGVSFFKQNGVDNIALVGHSFGGAVVIMAATMNTEVKAVVGLSSQTYGTDRVNELSPKPLLLIHGERDRNLPVRSSWHIFGRAKEPKEIVIYKGSGHFLRECHQELYELLIGWLIDKLKMKGQDK
jgi:alpha/beta superfamily hydrolase